MSRLVLLVLSIIGMSAMLLVLPPIIIMVIVGADIGIMMLIGVGDVVAVGGGDMVVRTSGRTRGWDAASSSAPALWAACFQAFGTPRLIALPGGGVYGLRWAGLPAAMCAFQSTLRALRCL
jgi:hypothetical protein